MTPIEIMQKIEICQQALTKGNIELKTLGIKKSEAERLYRVALSKKLLELRLEKCPVSIIQDIAKGSDEINKLRLERDISENAYSVCLESMRNLRQDIEVLRSFLTYMRAEYLNT